MPQQAVKRKRGTLALIFRRRSIRIFAPSRPSREVVELLVEAGQRAPCVYQSYAVIRITREELRRRLYDLTGDSIIQNAPILLVLCLDLRRLRALFDIVEPLNLLAKPPYPVEALEAVFEAGLFVENLILAGESLGYSSVILDWPLRLGSEFQEALRLPTGVIPLFMICMGPPAENPPTRPRLPTEMVLMDDAYVEARREDMERYLEEASEKLALEGYLLKYAGTRATYRQYLAEKIRLDIEAERLKEEVSRFLRLNGLAV
jgi:nitroreductase